MIETPDPKPAAPVKTDPAAFAGARILVTEDNKVNQKVIKVLLKKLGCEVDVAENGREALDRIAEKRYDLVFMDCQMQVMDGYEATRRIRASERDGEHLTVVAMTANAMEGDRERCLETGMDEYIPKPINRPAIVKLLSRYLVDAKATPEPAEV